MLEDRVIFAPEVAEKCGFTLPTLWRECKRENFPASFQVGGTRRKGWRLSTVLAWMEQQEAATPEEAAAARERSRAQRKAEDAARES